MEELLQVVLQRCPGEQQLVVDLVPIQDSEKLLRTSHEDTCRRRWCNLRRFLLRTHEEQKLGGTFDWLFFSLWASSTTKQAHVTEPRMAWSMVMSS